MLVGVDVDGVRDELGSLGFGGSNPGVCMALHLVCLHQHCKKL